jgi:hypothetical protein
MSGILTATHLHMLLVKNLKHMYTKAVEIAQFSLVYGHM